MPGAACATGGNAGGVTGVGGTRVAPGDPVAGAAAGAVTDCGPTRLRTCASDGLGSDSNPAIAAKPAAAALRQTPLNTPLPIRFFSVAIAAISSRANTQRPAAAFTICSVGRGAVDRLYKIPK